MTRDQKSALTWWPIDFIAAAAKHSGDHVREDWTEHGGEYGLNLPASLRSELERTDWRRVTPAEVLDLT